RKHSDGENGNRNQQHFERLANENPRSACGKGEERDRCLHPQNDREVIPPAVLGRLLSQQKIRIAASVVMRDLQQAREEPGSGQPAAPATSVVASPACARNGGSDAKRRTAIIAATSPMSFRAMSAMSSSVSATNTRFPRRAFARLWM